MIDFIFTLDYEIYGNGTGSLRELVYDPAETMREIFGRWNARFVNFVEVAELAKIDEANSDAAIELVKRQIREMHKEGHETALHLHPQWHNARLENGRWLLDATQYNLCTLPRSIIVAIVRDALNYLRDILGERQFTPFSFRAGNWLFQPSSTAAEVLAEHGLRIDSSVFKGGVQHQHGLDYRGAARNGYFWPFSSEVTEVNHTGPWLEVPIYAEMVPAWKMATGKRMRLGGGHPLAANPVRQRVNRLRDLTRLRYPKKLDFCRMTLPELTSMMDNVLRHDSHTPDVYKPVVAIGHTKDFSDPETLDRFLGCLAAREIPIVTFQDIYLRLLTRMSPAEPVPAAV